jgi:hypothetical protein
MCAVIIQQEFSINFPHMQTSATCGSEHLMNKEATPRRQLQLV